jgi:2-methylcitrate dehydratase PrpD
LEEILVREYARVLAEFVVGLQYSDLEKDVIEKAKMHFLDTIGVSLAAVDMPWSQIVIDTVKKLGGSKESTILGDKTKTSSILAALANGTLAHGIDMDDSIIPGWAHTGASVVPSALAMAEVSQSSGKDFITAVVLGYDIGCRLDAAAYPGLRQRGFHATGLAGTFGAAAAAGKILGLNEDQMTNTFGLAGTQAAGLEEWLYTGDMSKRMHPGKAAMNGILAALLAQEGFTGPATVFEGKYGFFKTHSETYHIEKLTEGLRKDFKIMNCKIKPFACCHELSGPVRLALEMLKRYKIKPEGIERIAIGLNKTTAENDFKVAHTPLDAQNHPAVAVAIALVRGHVFFKEFFESYNDPTVILLGNKTDVYVDPDIDRAFPVKTGARLTVTTKKQDYSLFEEDWPEITEQFVKEKFTKLVSSHLSQKDVEKVTKNILHLEELGNMRDLTAHCVRRYKN